MVLTTYKKLTVMLVLWRRGASTENVTHLGGPPRSDHGRYAQPGILFNLAESPVFTSLAPGGVRHHCY
jgi:hypothetical protein